MGEGGSTEPPKKNDNAAKSPTQRRREKVATIARELVSILNELDGVETVETFRKGYDGAGSAIREIFAPLKKGKARDAEIDRTVIPNAESVLDAYKKGLLDLDANQRAGSLGALAALAKFLAEETPPF